MKAIKLKPVMTVEESDKLQGKLLDENSFVLLCKEDIDVYDSESGKCIAKFRKKVIPANVQLAAFNNLLTAATPTDARGSSSGEQDGSLYKQNVLTNGKQSKQNRAKVVNSGLAGYFDRSVRFPNCRLTAFNRHHMDKFKAAYPIIKLVSDLYSVLMPKEYKVQKGYADKTSPDFMIPNTVFTTVTVNKNWQTAVHKDAGDLQEGFGNLVALRKGTFTGGYFVLPRWGVAFDIQNGDLLLVDVHQWHGNTPIHKDDPKAVRLSLVMYYREKMIKCGSMKEELKRVKERKKGDKL